MPSLVDFSIFLIRNLFATNLIDSHLIIYTVEKYAKNYLKSTAICELVMINVKTPQPNTRQRNKIREPKIQDNSTDLNHCRCRAFNTSLNFPKLLHDRSHDLLQAHGNMLTPQI